MDNVLVSNAIFEIERKISGTSLIVANLKKFNNSSDFNAFNDYLDSLKDKFPDIYVKMIDIIWKHLF